MDSNLPNESHKDALVNINKDNNNIENINSIENSIGSDTPSVSSDNSVELNLVDNQQSRNDPLTKGDNSRFTYIDDGSGIIDHYVDQLSDVDSSSDQGLHDVFDDLKATDNIYDNITENVSNVTLINAQSFEIGWPPTGWTATGRWNRESNRFYDGFFSADFDGPDGFSDSGYLTSPILDTSDASSIFIEFYYYDENLDVGEFSLELFDGISWDTNYVALDQDLEDQWNRFFVEITDPQYFKSNFRIRWFADPRSLSEHAYVDLITMKKSISQELELEMQFVDFAHFMGSETLAIKMGSSSSFENLSVSYWTGSSWSTLISNLLPNVWNNITVSITESQYTVRLEGSETDINWWQIDSILISIEGPGSNIYPVELDTSDVDSSPDKGSIINFDNAKATDSAYANFQEDASGTANTHSVDLTGGYLSSLTSDQTSNSGTISFWIKYDSVSGRQYGLDTDMEIRLSGSSLVLDWGTTGTMTSSVTFSPNIWYFNAITWNENQNRLLFYSAPAGTEPILDTNSLQGSWTSLVSSISFSSVYWGNGKGSNNPLDGHLDDIRYYDTDRSLNDILSDYNKSLIGNEPNLINYYKLDNDYADTGGSDDLTGSGSQSFSSDTPSWELGISNNQLDQEVQWTGVAHFLEEETLAIKTGTFNADENLLVDFWNGFGWQNLFSSLSENSWNNISISDFLNSTTFTIRFRDENTSILDNSWLIDSILIIVDTPNVPKVSNVLVSPLNPNSSIDITYTYSYFDYQNDPENLTLQEAQWYKNGVHQPSYDNLQILPQTATIKGEMWFVRLRVFDGQSYSKWSNSSTVVIGNSLPTATNVVYNVTQVDTNNAFKIIYTYFDYDGDPENKSRLYVK
ncbi:MAG: LamG-like jellyroll fold domain-containing protein [Candidatus Kariarchaeaceae archaeon]